MRRDMKANEGKWSQLMTNEGRGRQMERQMKAIEGRCKKMNGNEGIWRQVKANEGIK